eukprot:g18677.t1
MECNKWSHYFSSYFLYHHCVELRGLGNKSLTRLPGVALFRGRHSANSDPTPPITGERCERFERFAVRGRRAPVLHLYPHLTTRFFPQHSTSGNRTLCATASATRLGLDVRESDFRNPGDGSRPNDMNVLQTPASVQVHHALHPSYSAPDVSSHGHSQHTPRKSIPRPSSVAVLSVPSRRAGSEQAHVDADPPTDRNSRNPSSGSEAASFCDSDYEPGESEYDWPGDSVLVYVPSLPSLPWLSRSSSAYSFVSVPLSPGSPGHGTPCSEDAVDIAKDIDSEDFFDVAKDTSHASVEAHPSVPAAGPMGPQNFTFSVPTSLTKPRTSAAVRYSLTPQHRARTRSRGHQSLSFPCCLQCQCSHQQQVTLSVDHPLLVQTGRASFADTTSETNVTDQSS